MDISKESGVAGDDEHNEAVKGNGERNVHNYNENGDVDSLISDLQKRNQELAKYVPLKFSEYSFMSLLIYLFIAECLIFFVKIRVNAKLRSNSRMANIGAQRYAFSMFPSLP